MQGIYNYYYMLCVFFLLFNFFRMQAWKRGLSGHGVAEMVQEGVLLLGELLAL